MRILTNNKPRPVLSFWELDNSQKKTIHKEYGDLDDLENHKFIFYKGCAYLLSDFTRVDNNPWSSMPSNNPIVTGGWDGYLSESYSSGVLIKLQDSDNCIIGQFFC